MRDYKHTLPVALAIAFGLLTLVGLLFVPVIADSMTGWASFLAAVALLLGILNLLGVHGRRLFQGNLYSGVLVLSMLFVFVLAITDLLNITTEGVNTLFSVVQVPLEAAMASLLAFFLIFAAARLLRRQKSWMAILFIITVILLLLGQTLLPLAIGDVVFGRLSQLISDVIVDAGMRGILIGVALGAITVSLRLLTGSERPYDK